ncbi:MAG: glycosyltransferase family 2 protein [Candidatus Krumholzibacteriota bacterium]|nr:glycosyltransferase family 2 protein [Candidatus Krumholzibacteriota bacterium]
MGLDRVSLVVITRDEEENIARCIESAAGVGETIVVDSHSGDQTREIARSLGATVLERDFVSNADQKNWAIERTSGEWVLILDADERLTPALRDEIARSVDDPRGADGWYIRRRNDFLGRRIDHCGWGRDRVLRLFRRGAGRYPERAVHERFRLDGEARLLVEPMLHSPYRDMADYLDRMRSYSLRGAAELHGRGASWFPAILLRPAWRFMRMYVVQLGFLDGAAGLVLCGAAAAGVFFKYAALRELGRRDAAGADR